MELRAYQEAAARTSKLSLNEPADAAAATFGLVHEAGSIANVYKKYLRDIIDLPSYNEFLKVELGDLLWYTAAVATAFKLDLEALAQKNLVLTRDRYRTENGVIATEIKNLRDYQAAAVKTSLRPLNTPTDAIAAAFGLAHETGSIANVYKKHLYNPAGLSAHKELLTVELGDLLWYTAAVATAFNLDLEALAQKNLVRARDRYLTPKGDNPFQKLRVFDAAYGPTERFPRWLVFEFIDKVEDSQLTASLILKEAKPNAFPTGPIKVDDKDVGFQVNAQLGSNLTDNSRRMDGYRFHDAIHIGFLAVLGWSPIFRRLLQLKRRSDPHVDEEQDGARAAFAEEGLAHILARMSEKRRFFQTEENVDGDALSVMRHSTTELEADELPEWLWKRAIAQGFSAMHQLINHHGGHVIADLDERSLTYAKVRLPTT